MKVIASFPPFFYQRTTLCLFSPPSVSCTPSLWRQEVCQITGIFFNSKPRLTTNGLDVDAVFRLPSPRSHSYPERFEDIFFAPSGHSSRIFFHSPDFYCSTEFAAIIFLMQRSFVSVKAYTNQNDSMVWWLRWGGSNGRPLFFAPLVYTPFPILHTCPSSRKSEVCHQPRMEFTRCNTRPIAHLEAHFHFQTLELCQP